MATEDEEAIVKHHHWLPIILAIYLPVSFIITYSIAVGNDHVKPGFPYISDTGTKPPESCVFGQLVNMGAVLGGIIIYIRYKQILKQTTVVKTLNRASFFIGLLSIFGVSLVGNFEQTSVVVVHLIGAFLAFAVGFVYIILQTIISFKSTDLERPGNTPFIRKLRIVLCVVDAIFLILLGVAPQVAHSMGPGPGKSKFQWSPDDPGYAEHLVATISEWLVAFITVIYFATFYAEFRHFKLEAPKVVLNEVQTMQTSPPTTTTTTTA
ncbi:DNA damage-regulated autophagy modulator protein 1-like [Ruditapes philippinarum]|uniref:DNA damage-regulated autophagy modulator protein 1-like n=1 Tax=Ruditapes philippinarum TaxID=129788 RepID=UPI00295B2245|nr:DNA damage-regulated autophagy modulator protein 1-like [Ruditapes philippinarum]